MWPAWRKPAPSSLKHPHRDGFLLIHTPCHPPPQLTNFGRSWLSLTRPPGLRTRDVLSMLGCGNGVGGWIAAQSPVGSQIEVSKDRPSYKSCKRQVLYLPSRGRQPLMPIRLHLQRATHPGWVWPEANFPSSPTLETTRTSFLTLRRSGEKFISGKL